MKMSEVTVAMPDAFLREELKAKLGFDPLPLPGRYAVAQILSSWGSAPIWKDFLLMAEELGLVILARRTVPMNLKTLWPHWHVIDPEVTQVFLQGASLLHSEFAKRLRVLQTEFRANNQSKYLSPFHICSLSATSITYKMPIDTKVPDFYYPDLKNPEVIADTKENHSELTHHLRSIF